LTVNRLDFQRLADLRVADAKALLADARFDGAYYLGGYAVECALKSCICSQVREHDFPDKAIVNESYQHNLERLLDISGIKQKLNARLAVSKDFAGNWNVVKDWSEHARYEHGIAEVKARDLLKAIDDPDSGILTWLKTVW
jgi:hypothetical protein